MMARASKVFTLAGECMLACVVLLGMLVCVVPVDGALAQQDGPKYAIPIAKGPGFTGFEFAAPNSAAGLPLISNGAANPAFGPNNDQTTVLRDPSKFWNPTYYANPGTGVIHRFNRILVGLEALQGGQVPQSPTSWVGSYITDVMAVGSIASTNPLGQLGIVGASRTSDYRAWVGSASGGSQGITGIAVNDDATAATTPIACGVCGVAFRDAGVVGITLNQFDVNNAGAVVVSTPYTGVNSGSTWATGLTAGAYPSGTSNVSGAIYIGAGSYGAKFVTGIVSMSDALDTSLGSGGGGIFAEMARGQSIIWMNSGATNDAELYSGANGLNLRSALNLGIAGTDNGSLRIGSSSGGTLTQNYSATASNATITWGSSSGTPAISVPSPLSLSTSTGAVTWSGLTSGGVLYASGTTSVASSALLTANQLVLGGGAGTAPATLGSLGTTTTLLHGNASGAPTFGAVVSADMNITTTSCTNKFVTAISSGGVGTCTTDTLAGAQHANQGTTTTVLHGNAAGNPSWGAVSLTADITGTLGVGNGGTGITSGTSGGVPYYSASNTIASSAALTANAIVKGGGAGSAPVASGCTIDANNAIACSSSSAFQPPLTMTNTTSDTNGPYNAIQKSKGGGAVDSGTAIGGFAWQPYTTGYSTTATIAGNTEGAVSGAFVQTGVKISTSNSSGYLNQALNFSGSAHLSVTASASPTLSSCGSSPSISGTDFSGTVTMGTGSPTGCVITFAVAYGATPKCRVTWQTNLASMQYALATGTITLTQTATSSNKVDYQCDGA